MSERRFKIASYAVCLREGQLLGVGSRTQDVDWGIPGGAELHSMATYYLDRVVGGELCNEVDGSTDLAAGSRSSGSPTRIVRSSWTSA